MSKTITKTHTLYPVSYLADDGSQINTVWAFEPIGEDIHIGESFEVTLEHPVLGDDAKAKTIAELEKKLAALKS